MGSSRVAYVVTELRTHFNLFAYGTLRRGGSATSLLRGCEHIGIGATGGVLYDIDGEFPALVLYGATPVHGDVWRCPNEVLQLLDTYERVDAGLFRRVGVTVRVGPNEAKTSCWAYVAGPYLSRKLSPGRRIARWD